MSDFWVLPHLFKASCTIIDWADEAGSLGYQGPWQPTHDERYGAFQFRWLLHPALGLPLEPFEVWRNQGVQSGLTAQEMANLPGWEPLERVGLPVDDAWGGTNYRLGEQGPESTTNPPQLSPIDAAAARLQLGAPRIGWTQLDLGGGETLPEWKPPNLDAYHEDTIKSRLLDGIRNMLRSERNPLRHASHYETETDSEQTGALHPHLLDNPEAIGGRGQDATNTWQPLGLLLLAAGTDPLASLVLGFGTAMEPTGEWTDAYMVSVRHEIEVGDNTFKFQLADVVSMRTPTPAPGPPRGVRAGLRGHTRPQVLDGPAIDSVGVEWERAANPSFGFQPPETPRPVSYAIGRVDHLVGRGNILLTRRRCVGGYLAFVPSKPDKDRPALFTDHLLRQTTVDGQVLGSPGPADRTYAVAAQDLFGRWSRWQTSDYAEDAEPPQIPTVFAVELDDAGDLTVDFGWDWSSRTPEFVELTGAFEDDPGNPLLSIQIGFGGGAEADTGLVVPLGPDLTEVAGWGAEQDRDPAAPEVRFYRLSTSVGFDFRGLPARRFQVMARGQCHLTELLLPGFGVSDFGRPVSTEVIDPSQPNAPGGIPEAPQWASLRDASGVSRAVLRWGGVGNSAGYVLYEATESALLAAALPNEPGPDPNAAYTDRLARLRGLNLAGPALRREFRRLRSELIQGTSDEVTLPRGSTVIHMYAVTAMGNNRVESAWPGNSKGFFAVAAPRSPVPAAPSLEAGVDPQSAAPKVKLSVIAEPSVIAVEIYRTTNDALAADADTMGPPVAPPVTVVAGVAEFEDTGVSPGWERISYRAVAWSAPDPQRGLIEARSPASNAVSVLLPPPAPPAVSDLRVDEPGTTATDTLVSWTSGAPARPSPMGHHVVILELAQTGVPIPPLRLEAALDALPAFASVGAIPPANPADRKVVRVGTPESYRLYAWLPRPAPGHPGKLRVKAIDPLGRIGTASAALPDVP